MNVTVLGATGALGTECVAQALERGHRVTVLARDPGGLRADLAERIEVVRGDALVADDVAGAIPTGTGGVLFAIGVDRNSPEDLCTDATRNAFAAMGRHGVRRFVWCGGGSTHVPEDTVTLGSRFVGAFASAFLGLRHRDKAHQLAFLQAHREIDWLGVRPLQMRTGPRREVYRLGYDAFSGFSKIHFADCAHAMLGMLEDDTWLHQAPILQY